MRRCPRRGTLLPFCNIHHHTATAVGRLAARTSCSVPRFSALLIRRVDSAQQSPRAHDF
jgi:hypothetical protein